MLLFRPIWQKGLYPWKWSERSENRITKQLRDESQTYPDGIRFLRGLLNKPRSSIWFTNKCKNNSLVNGLRFVFLTQKEPVIESFVNEADYTGRAAARATIVHSLVKDVFVVFFCHYFRYAVIAAAEKSTWNTAYIYILFCDNSAR